MLKCRFENAHGNLPVTLLQETRTSNACLTDFDFVPEEVSISAIRHAMVGSKKGTGDEGLVAQRSVIELEQ